MSKTREIYANYLEKWQDQHPNVVQPEVVENQDAAKDLFAEARARGTLHSHCTKYWTHCNDCAQYNMPDGRVIEFAWKMMGLHLSAVVFASKEEHSNYDQPMSSNVYFERW